MDLEKELETYNQNLAMLQASQGKYVLIQGDEVIDTFGTYEDAVKEGYQKFGVDTPFLVRQIQATEQIQLVTRLLGVPCHI